MGTHRRDQRLPHSPHQRPEPVSRYRLQAEQTSQRPISVDVSRGVWPDLCQPLHLPILTVAKACAFQPLPSSA